MFSLCRLPARLSGSVARRVAAADIATSARVCGGAAAAYWRRRRREAERAAPLPTTAATSVVARMIMKEKIQAEGDEGGILPSDTDEGRPPGDDFDEMASLLAATRLIGRGADPSRAVAVDEIVLTGVERVDRSVTGTADPAATPSDVPCAGCGAPLHCCDPSRPGYMTSEKFRSTQRHLLREAVCRRCTLMRDYDIALNVSVLPEQYDAIIAPVRDTRALVVIVVDVTDLPSSLFSRISQLVGDNRPIFVVANKVDLLPPDGRDWLARVRDTLDRLCDEAGLFTTHDVRHVALVSAKTKFGVEDLITRLLQDWGKEGDIYILGCTNVGKSTLFNALLSSDYCKSRARDFYQRATVCQWPGTTLNLLKFPVFNPAKWMMHQRTLRLHKETSSGHASKEHSVAGAVGETFAGLKTELRDSLEYEGFASPSYAFDDDIGAMRPGVTGNRHLLTRWQQRVGVFDESRYDSSRWCYDTPGLVNPDQVINQLTQAELSVTLTQKCLVPRSFAVKPTQTMFLSGLGRIDYTAGVTTLYFTVFASSNMPIHVVNQEDVDEFYAENIGTSVLGVPLGDEDRLSDLSPLAPTPFSLTGAGWRRSAADVILSSIGWVAITGGRGLDISLTAHTPGARGCALRTPALLPYAVNQRGKRQRGRASYAVRPRPIRADQPT